MLSLYFQNNNFGGIHLQMLFRYNWQVRQDWYKWCEDVSEEELLKARVGGVGGILHTLFHIVDVEWSWIRIIQGKSDFQEKFSEFSSLRRVRELDADFRQEVEELVNAWDATMENRLFNDPQPDGSVGSTAGERLCAMSSLTKSIMLDNYPFGQGK